MSYHVRQLERFGFVTAGDDADDARLRRWSATSTRTILDRRLLNDPAISDAAVALVKAQAAPALNALAAALRSGLDESWSGAVMSFDHELRLDGDQLAEMRNELEAVVERYFEASKSSPAPNATTVAVYLAAAPETAA